MIARRESSQALLKGQIDMLANRLTELETSMKTMATAMVHLKKKATLVQIQEPKVMEKIIYVPTIDGPVIRTETVTRVRKIRIPGKRATRYTREVLTLIPNLVEQGKSREEIAEQLGTTMNSLQATCSKVGISLRRPKKELCDG
jgi:hypothetical protein